MKKPLTSTESASLQAAALRQKAEDALRRQHIDHGPVMPEEAQRLNHELEVHQIELEMQNDELRRVQEELKNTLLRYYDLYDLAPVGYFTLSEKGLILEANLTACSLLGVDRSKLLRHPLSRYMLTEDADLYYLCLKKLFETQEKQAFDIRMLKQGGAPFHARIEANVAQDTKTGTPVCRAVLSDITEHSQARAALNEKNADLERFARSVAHDLKTPLVTIRTFLGHFVEDITDNDKDRMVQDLAYINSAAEKMDALLDELLKFSQIGCVITPSVEAPLQEIVQEALSLTAGRIDKRGVQVTVTEKPVLLYGDRVRIVEIFQNLIDNAVKFMGGQTKPLIEIGAEMKPGEIVCSVRDNGMGIDQRHKDKLFGLFEKLNSGMEGSGMGLALAKRIIEVHGGRIWVESAGLGKGACFYFTLPRKSSES